MKKYIIVIASFFFFQASNSCSDRDLFLTSPSSDDIEDVNTEAKLQQFLNSSYFALASVNAYGTAIPALSDILSDNVFVTNSNNIYSLTKNADYTATDNDFSFYGTMYDAIMNCNIVINNTTVPNSANVARIKAEARIARAFAYFTLVNYFSPSPTSGVNQDFGVPIVLGNYDVSIQPARASVGEVYNQIISDLQASLQDAASVGGSQPLTKKVTFTKTAAKLLLAKVYLTRRAAGDAQLALQYSSEIVNNSSSEFAPIASSSYVAYFSGIDDEFAEGHSETIWELDLNMNTNNATGIGANLSLPGLYSRTDSRRALLVTRSFYNSFPVTDVRRGNGTATSLLTTVSAPPADTPPGAWTNKYPRLTSNGNYVRNIKILRFADAQLSRIEALHLTGQNATALAELNNFALSRGGSTYTGTDMLNDILTERAKEFYGEGKRFLDLKRYNLPLVRGTNCTTNCTIPANDKRFVFPIDQEVLNFNSNLKQYPGYEL